MARAWRICTVRDCGELVPPGTSRCGDHAAEYERHRGTPTERGYGPEHQAQRHRWAPKVEAGQVDCSRCGQRIAPDEPWHLDHDDEDRTRYLGPSHAYCNTRAGGHAEHRCGQPLPAAANHPAGTGTAHPLPEQPPF